MTSTSIQTSKKLGGNLLWRRHFVAAFFLVSLFSATVVAGTVVVPGDLNVGDTYHLVFVTAGKLESTSTDISIYNNFVQTAAAGNPSLTGTDMGVNWFAIASTASIDAKVNAVVGASSPVYLLDGTTKVADDFADMWNTNIDLPINLTENLGSPVGASNRVWTGSSADGTEHVGFSLGLASVTSGNLTQTGAPWLKDLQSDGAGNTYHLYALSSELTVVPEPTTFALGIVSAVGLLGFLWRRRRR